MSWYGWACVACVCCAILCAALADVLDRHSRERVQADMTLRMAHVEEQIDKAERECVPALLSAQKTLELLRERCGIIDMDGGSDP